jgi:hypothetical protein
MKPKKKCPDNFRVHLGDKYCSLSFRFHELGVCIPDCDLESAHVFTNLNAANYAVARTHEMRDKVKASMIPDFKGLQPLLFVGDLSIERFQPELATIGVPA